MKFWVMLWFSFFTISSYAGPAYDAIVKGLPKDAVQIVDRRIGCSYWPGEMPNNPNDPDVRASGRPQIIEKKLKELKCEQLERDEKAVREKYIKKKDILKAFNESASLTPAD
jgi:hypothetical protein